MRRIRGIIESSVEPTTTDCIWIKGSEAKYYTNGKWTGVGEASYKIDWTDGTHHVNQLLFHPVYEITGERRTNTDGLPILNYASGHTIYGKLFVLNSSINDNELCYTQVLMLSNRIGGDGHTYIRTGRIQKKDSATIDALTATDSPYWGTWESTVTTKEVLSIESKDDLDNMVDNGLYTAVVKNNITLLIGDSVAPGSNKGIQLAMGEGILVFTINNYAIFSLFPSLQQGYNAGITQYIFRTKPVLKNAQYNPLTPIIIRSAHKVDTRWIWDDISTIGITDEYLKGGNRRLSLDALFRAMGYTYYESSERWKKGDDSKTTKELLDIIAAKVLA